MLKLYDVITKYSILMFLISGILIFLLDLRELKTKKLKREIKMAKIVGFSLIAIGVLFFVVKLFI